MSKATEYWNQHVKRITTPEYLAACGGRSAAEVLTEVAHALNPNESFSEAASAALNRRAKELGLVWSASGHPSGGAGYVQV